MNNLPFKSVCVFQSHNPIILLHFVQPTPILKLYPNNRNETPKTLSDNMILCYDFMIVQNTTNNKALV